MKKSNHITEANYYERLADIGEDLCRNIVRGLQEVYTAKYIVRPDYNLGGNYFNVSFYYDIPYEILYVTYSLDFGRTAAVRASEQEIHNRVYDWIRYTQRDKHIKVQLVGEFAELPENNRGRNNPYIRHTNKELRIGTRALWWPALKGKISPHFIESKAQLQDDIKKCQVTYEEQLDFISRVEELNSRYNLILDSHSNYTQMFEEFNRIYREYFNKTLSVFLPRKTFDIHIDITHDEEAEKVGSETHDYGFYYNPEYVSTLILDKRIVN